MAMMFLFRMVTLLVSVSASLRNREHAANESVDAGRKVSRIASLSLSVLNVGNASNATGAVNVSTSEAVVLNNSIGAPIADVQKVVAVGASTQTAETAVRNGVAITANDAAWLVNDFRGEDVGACGSAQTFEGDMMVQNSSQLDLLRRGRLGWVAAGQPWPEGNVKYCFASDATESVRYMFELAVAQYTKAVPCLNFTNVGWLSGTSSDGKAYQQCKESPAIFVMSSPSYGCYSYVGVIPGWKSQQLQLNDPGCLIIGTVIHEIGHALGMVHEQSRPDRDSYVRVNYDNVRDGVSFDFSVQPDGYTGNAYDYYSVMHYDAFAFAKDKTVPTIERLDGSSKPLGQRVGLSTNDVEQVTAMYLEVNSACQATALNGLGCMDAPNAAGEISCPSKGSFCSLSAFSRCCSCGGGTVVQCYTGDASCSMGQSAGFVQQQWPMLLCVMVGVVFVVLSIKIFGKSMA